MNEQARVYIAEMLGHRIALTTCERDILRQLLATPTIKNRFPTISLDDLCGIADEIVAERAAERRPRWRRSG